MGFMVMLASGVFGILVLVYGIQEIRHQVKNWWTYFALLLGVFLLGFAIYLFNPFLAYREWGGVLLFAVGCTVTDYMVFQK